MVQKAVLFWVFVSAVSFVEVQALFDFGLLKNREDAFADYVVSDKTSLKYSMSDERPRQLVLYNDKTKTGLVIDGTSDMVVFEKLNGDKLVMDLRNEKVFEGNSVPDLTEDDFQKLLTDYNTTTLLVEKPFNNQSKPPEVVVGFFHNQIGCLRTILQVKRTICKAIVSILSPIFEVLKFFGAILTLGAETVFKVLKGGLLALLNIFKSLARLLEKITGGIVQILDAGIELLLGGILGAANGALALWEILKCFIEQFDLMKILQSILKIPKMLCNFISGLGGKIISGVTGVFEIVAKIFTFKISHLYRLVGSFVEMILDFFKGGRPSRVQMNEAVDNLLEISNKQKIKYKNPQDYKNYEEFLLATRGEGKFKVQGVHLGKIVNIVMETGFSAKDAVLEIFNALHPLAPMKAILPVLMVTTIKSLNTTEGVGYVKQLFPDVEIPDGALTGATRNLAAELIIPETWQDYHLLDLPPPEKLRSMPIVKDIYKEFDEAAIIYTNSSLESLMQKQYVVHYQVEFSSDVVG